MIRVLTDVYVAYYAWNFTGDIPPSACLLLGFGYFLYVVHPRKKKAEK